jgi:hypothetical protein
MQDGLRRRKSHFEPTVSRGRILAKAATGSPGLNEGMALVMGDVAVSMARRAADVFLSCLMRRLQWFLLMVGFCCSRSVLLAPAQVASASFRTV